MSDGEFMKQALQLARRGYGNTSPNPMVGAVLTKGGQVIGRGWHRKAGSPHAEIEALDDAARRGKSPRGATLYVTLEPCSTHGRTPPCTEAITRAGIKRVVIGTTDPNPKHAGNGLRILRRAGLKVECIGDQTRNSPSKMHGAMGSRLHTACARLNEGFNHWIVKRTPFVTVKAAMTLDGKIATANGESKWITGATARAYGMKLRQGSDAILVGVNTILHDDPSLNLRGRAQKKSPQLRRIVLDSMARTPLTAKVVSDELRSLTTIVVTRRAPQSRVSALRKRVDVLVAPMSKASTPDLRWLLKKLGADNVVNLLVEGGGEVNASFLLHGLAQRVAFFYAPKILGGRDSRRAVGGEGASSLSEILQLAEVEWRKLGADLLLTGLVNPSSRPQSAE